jgi:hypothetical protein
VRDRQQACHPPLSDARQSGRSGGSDRSARHGEPPASIPRLLLRQGGQRVRPRPPQGSVSAHALPTAGASPRMPATKTDRIVRRLLHGRPSECEALDRRLEYVRAGQSQVRVVRGEAGSARPPCSGACRRGPRDAGSRERSELSPKLSWRMPVFISCARHSWIASGVCPTRKAHRCARRSGWGAAGSVPRWPRRARPVIWGGGRAPARLRCR